MKKSTPLIRLINLIPIILIPIFTTWSCVNNQATPTPAMEEIAWPTPASTLQELLENISKGDAATKFISIYGLEKYGDDAAISIPILIESLHDNNSDVRRAAIYILGTLGAEAAVPDLMYVLENDDAHHPKRAAAEALGDIGDTTAIPALAMCLSNINIERDGFWIQAICAKSIGRITGENFTDINSTVYTLDNNDVPLIVIDAQKWWTEKGQFQTWEAIK
ncbi:MAG TPA: HEAT repeat domain-containing protein [Anaerolineales bacterium]|nr:HEAT repeat domain-containing protein [Anaerolineales bacterium]